MSEVLEHLQGGKALLELVFGPRFLRLLVPPWNRISDAVSARLPDLGYLGLSTFGNRLRREPVPGLVLLNAHVDLLTWRNGGRFAGREKVLGELVRHLEARRTGTDERHEPIGLLTHHEDHDAEAWAFLEQLLRATTSHSGARWVGVRQALAM